MTAHSSGAAAGSSPHTRGARQVSAGFHLGCRIIPAYAGSTGLPVGIVPLRHGSSPHTRGAQETRRPRRRESRIIPAYAGSTTISWGATGPSWDHPRIRGEHGAESYGAGREAGSSPHTRGAHRLALHELALERIIPAYAGSTQAGASLRIVATDHPRIRGEHHRQLWNPIYTAGSSPHTRGARRPVDSQPGPPRIIPAYAGSTVWDGFL